MVLIRNYIFILISSIIWAMVSFASANTCTDAMYKVLISNKAFFYSESNFKLDSIYEYDFHNASAINEEYINEYIKDYIINNGKLEKIIKTNNLGVIDSLENHFEPDTTYFHHDTDETVLKNYVQEYIVSNYETNDTLNYTLAVYNKGEKIGEIKSKIFESNNYTSIEYWATTSTDNDEYPKSLTEYFLKKDTIIEQETAFYNADSIIIGMPTKYVADPANDLKCYKIYRYYSISETDTTYGEAQGSETYLYRPYGKGFVIKQYYDNSASKDYTETFIIDPTVKTSIRKTRKMVKIAPKARYFDLLGRYKFTK